MKETKRNYCVALVSMVVIAILCYRAFYFPENMFVKRRIALYVGLVVLVVLVPVLMIRITGLNRWLTHVIGRFCACNPGKFFQIQHYQSRVCNRLTEDTLCVRADRLLDLLFRRIRVN